MLVLAMQFSRSGERPQPLGADFKLELVRPNTSGTRAPTAASLAPGPAQNEETAVFASGQSRDQARSLSARPSSERDQLGP